MGDVKKRRKKKLKKSLSQANSEPVDNDSPDSISNINEQNVPDVSDEILQIKQEQTTSNMQTDGETSKSTSQTMPINLTNEHGKVKSEMDSISYGTALNESMDVHNFPSAICKIGM